MQHGQTREPASRGIAYRGFRQILSVTVRTIEPPRSMPITAVSWSTLPEPTNLEFCGELFNVLIHPNFLFAKSDPQSGNNSTIQGTPQFGDKTAARDPQLGLW